MLHLVQFEVTFITTLHFRDNATFGLGASYNSTTAVCICPSVTLVDCVKLVQARNTSFQCTVRDHSATFVAKINGTRFKNSASIMVSKWRRLLLEVGILINEPS